MPILYSSLVQGRPLAGWQPKTQLVGKQLCDNQCEAYFVGNVPFFRDVKLFLDLLYRQSSWPQRFCVACAMLPFCDRHSRLPRTDVAPVWTRSFPIAKEPTTLVQRLKKKRFLAGMRQAETAAKLGVSDRTLSLWETDRVYPARAFQPRLITYLGYNPFNDPTLRSPKSNETSCVAFLSPEALKTIGQP